MVSTSRPLSSCWLPGAGLPLQISNYSNRITAIIKIKQYKYNSVEVKHRNISNYSNRITAIIKIKQYKYNSG